MQRLILKQFDNGTFYLIIVDNYGNKTNSCPGVTKYL